MANAPHLVIDAKRAAELYDRLGNWKAVARAMPRPDGSCFNAHSICRAVHLLDKRADNPHAYERVEHHGNDD